MKEISSEIILRIDDKKAIYHSETRTVTHVTRHNVEMSCSAPNDWALTRVFQFMHSLLSISDEII